MMDVDAIDRAAVLAAFGLDELEDDAELVAISRFAANLCQAPAAMVSVVETERQRFLAREGLDARETPRSTSMCATAMLGEGPLIVPDATKDERFAAMSLVTGEAHLRFYAGAPIVSEEGVPIGALCVIDTEPRPDGLTPLQREGLTVLAANARRRLAARRANLSAEREIEAREHHLRDIMDGLPQIAWSATAEGRFDYFNSRWQEMSGLPAPTRTEDWHQVVHPDDAPETFERWGKCLERGEVFESEYRFRQADGSWRWVLSRAVPIAGQDGGRRWFGTVTDIDSNHRLSENRDLLARELSHRIKNIFAVVASLIALRARKHPELGAFAQELSAAIHALGRAHDYVRPLEGRKGDRLSGLLADLLAPYGDKDATRVLIAGNDCPIGPRAATPLALVFHELATNSVKYGALSAPSGRVEVTVDCDADRAHICWRELGGPSPDEPDEEQGFGSRLVEMAVRGQLQGTLTREWAAEGLVATLEVPIHAIDS